MVLIQSVSHVIGAHLEYMRKKFFTTSSPKNSKTMDLQQRPVKYDKDMEHVRGLAINRRLVLFMNIDLEGLSVTLRKDVRHVLGASLKLLNKGLKKNDVCVLVRLDIISPWIRPEHRVNSTSVERGRHISQQSMTEARATGSQGRAGSTKMVGKQSND